MMEQVEPSGRLMNVIGAAVLTSAMRWWWTVSIDLRLVDARDRLPELVVVGQDTLLPLVDVIDELGSLDAELEEDELGLGRQQPGEPPCSGCRRRACSWYKSQHGCGHDRVVIRVAMPHDKDFSH